MSEIVLYGRFVKYKVLDEILESFIPNLPKEINIFIDMTPIVLKLYNFDNIANPLGILSCMVNVPLHYRHYFNRLNVKSNIFLIYSSNDSANNYKFVSGYNSKERIMKECNSTVHTIVMQNIELLSTLTPYFPGIYLKRGTAEPTVIAYDLISKFSKNGSLPTTNIFISSTDYAYQLPVYAYNTLYIYKKNMMGENNRSEDASFGVTKNNALNAYISLNNKQLLTEDLNQEWISAFMVLNGLSCRDIKVILSYKRTINTLKSIVNTYNLISPESLYQMIQSLYKEKTVTLEEIYARYCAIDLNYQLTLYRQLPESLESNFLIDVYDQQALYDISTLYFTGINSIDFQKL